MPDEFSVIKHEKFRGGKRKKEGKKRKKERVSKIEISSYWKK